MQVEAPPLPQHMTIQQRNCLREIAVGVRTCKLQRAIRRWLRVRGARLELLLCARTLGVSLPRDVRKQVFLFLAKVN